MDPFARTFEVRLDDDRKGKAFELRYVGRPQEETAVRALHAPGLELLFGQGLVECHAQRVGIAPGGRHAQLLEEGGIKSATRAAAVSLGEIEDDVRCEGFEARHE